MKKLVKRNNASQIAILVARGKVKTADDLMKRYDCSFEQAIQLLSNPKFIRLVAGISLAESKLAWYGSAVPKIIEMIDSEDKKIAMQAIKLLGQTVEALKAGGSLEVNINLESLVKEFSSNLKKDDGLDNVVELEEFRRVINES